MTDSAEIDELWRTYRSTGDPKLREQLIVHYAPLAKFVAGRVIANLPSNVEQSDLISYGVFGLIDALERFDPERGIAFESFAIPRIRGAILDELRSLDWVPRSVRARARRIETAIAALEARLGQSPTDDQLADELDMSVDALHSALGQIARSGVMALDETVSDGEGTVTIGDMVSDDSMLPGKHMEEQEMRVLLGRSIAQLPDRERQVLGLYHFERLTLAEIGQVLGVSESRVCQIHTKALMQLRSKMRAQLRDT